MRPEWGQLRRDDRLFYWFGQGAAAAFSIPGLILVSAFVGFAGLAKDAGLTLVQTAFMTAVVWALPAKVVLVGSILSGGSLIAAAFAVTLSSVRLMPMVVAMMPEMRSANTRPWVLYLLSHFIAITSWVIAQERFPRVPREARTVFYGGLGTTLLTVNIIVVSVVFLLAARLPAPVSALLIFLTPMYFLTSLWGSARELAGRLAMIFGLVLGPVFHLWFPGLDLMLAGVTGGAAAFAVHLVVRRRRGA